MASAVGEHLALAVGAGSVERSGMPRGFGPGSGSGSKDSRQTPG